MFEYLPSSDSDATSVYCLYQRIRSSNPTETILAGRSVDNRVARFITQKLSLYQRFSRTHICGVVYHYERMCVVLTLRRHFVNVCVVREYVCVCVKNICCFFFMKINLQCTCHFCAMNISLIIQIICILYISSVRHGKNIMCTSSAQCHMKMFCKIRRVTKPVFFFAIINHNNRNYI